MDGGIEAVIDVLKPMLTPFVLFVAKYSKNMFKEPKEDFQHLAVQMNIKPVFKGYKDQQFDVCIHDYLGIPAKGEKITEKLCKVDIIYMQGKVMESGYGGNKQ